MRNIFVKPAVDGAMVPDELTHQPLAAAGEWKPETAYWVRRLRDKDVVEMDDPPNAAAVAAETDKPRVAKR